MKLLTLFLILLPALFSACDDVPEARDCTETDPVVTCGGQPVLVCCSINLTGDRMCEYEVAYDGTTLAISNPEDLVTEQASVVVHCTSIGQETTVDGQTVVPETP